MFCCALLYFHFSFAIHLDGEERAGCFTLFVFLVSRDFYVALPHDAMGLSAVCDCRIFRSFSLLLTHFLLFFSVWGVGVRILNLYILRFFLEKLLFWGYGDFVNIFWASQNWKIGLLWGVISMHFRVFS